MVESRRRFPQDGDVVVQRETRDGRPLFYLHIGPAADQFVLHSPDAAMTLAIMFAKHQTVGAWMTNGHTFTLLEDGRTRRTQTRS
jgi:hypothetical protein